MYSYFCGIFLLLSTWSAIVADEQPCGVSADVAFLLDGSAGIEDKDFTLQKQFVKDAIGQFDIGEGGTRVSLLQYADDVTVDFYLDQFDNTEDIGQRLDKITRSSGGVTQPDVHLAIQTARTKLLDADHARWGVPRICVVVSGSDMVRPELTLAEARLAKDAGMILMAVGVGKGYNQGHLEKLVTEPAKEHFAYAEIFQDLKFVQFQQLAWLRRCKAPPTTVSPATSAPSSLGTYLLSTANFWTASPDMSTYSSVPTDSVTSTEGMLKDSPERGCQGKPADVVFLLDMSSSIWSVHFGQQLQFVANVIDAFDVDSGKTRVGAVVFSDNASVVFDVDTYASSKDVSEAILNIKSSGGITNTHKALQLVLDRMFTPQHGSRPGAAHICILITDGRSSSPQATSALADKAHNSGISVFTIGVGNMTNPKELARLASKPTEQFMFEVNGYEALPKIKDILAFKTCEVLQSDQPDKPRCFSAHKTDIIFGLYNIGGSHRDQVTEFIKSVGAKLDFTSGTTRIAVIESNGNANLTLAEYSDVSDLRDAVDTTMDTGISGMIQDMRKIIAGSRRRSDINRVAVMFVSGKIKDMRRAYTESMRLKFFSIVVVVGIGQGVDTDQLMTLATHRNKYEQDNSHVLPINDLSELPLVVEKLRVLMCKDE